LPREDIHELCEDRMWLSLCEPIRIIVPKVDRHERATLRAHGRQLPALTWKNRAPAAAGCTMEACFLSEPTRPASAHLTPEA